MTDSESGATDTEPCRHCGAETAQRADGKPYCSSTCIEGRRFALKTELFRCPFPQCDWEIEYRPDRRYGVRKMRNAAEKHRREKHGGTRVRA